MGSHPAETSQDWIQLLVIIGGKWTKAENVITAPCTLQKGQKNNNQFIAYMHVNLSLSPGRD